MELVDKDFDRYLAVENAFKKFKIPLIRHLYPQFYPHPQSTIVAPKKRDDPEKVNWLETGF